MTPHAAKTLAAVLFWTLTTAAWAIPPAAVDRAGEPANPDAADAADQAAADAPVEAPVIAFRPASISMNSSVNFDMDGNQNHNNSNMSINLYCLIEGDVMPLAYTAASVDEAVTSAGEELNADPNRMHRGRNRLWINNNNGRQYFQVYFNLPAPAKPAKSIKTMTGSITLEMPKGKVRQVRLSPVSEFWGKHARVLDMNDATIGLAPDDHNEGMFKVSYDGSMEPLIQEILFYGANGQPLNVDHSGGGSGGNVAYKRYRGKLPDDGSVVIKLYMSTESVEVPFKILDIPLPGADRKEVFDVAVMTEPLGEGRVNVAGEDDLKVEIIEEPEAPQEEDEAAPQAQEEAQALPAPVELIEQLRQVVE